MVLLKPSKHGLFVRNVRLNDILYADLCFARFFMFPKGYKPLSVYGEEGKKDEQADYMRGCCKKG